MTAPGFSIKDRVRGRLPTYARPIAIALLTVGALLFLGGQSARPGLAQGRGQTLFVGGYGREGVVRIDGVTGARRTILAIAAPTAMLADTRRQLVFVASELSGGKSNLRVVNNAGTELARAWSGGAAPVALALSPDGSRLAVANYDGSLAVLTLAANGLPVGQPAIFAIRGRGPNSKRQSSAHPHGVVFSANGSFLYVADLGGDQLLRYRLEESTGVPLLVQTLAVSPGAGPRHLSVSNGTALVANELDGSLAVLRLEADGALTLTAHIVLGGVPSQVIVHPGGRWAVALVRGADLCAVVRLDPPPVTVASSVACKGSPRAAIWDADHGLVVAMQKGGRVDRYGFDEVTGVLSFERTLAKVKGAAGLALL